MALGSRLREIYLTISPCAGWGVIGRSLSTDGFANFEAAKGSALAPISETGRQTYEDG